MEPKGSFSIFPGKAALALLFSAALLGASPFQQPGDAPLTYADQRWWDAGFFLAPGVWLSDEEKVSLGGIQAGLTLRRRVPPQKIGSIFELGFMRFDNSVSNVSRKFMASGLDTLFLPSLLTWSFFLNGGRYSRNVGEFAPFVGAGLALVNHVNVTDTNQAKNGVALFGKLGVELAALPPTIHVRLSASVGAERLLPVGSAAWGELVTNNTLASAPFFAFTAALVLYLK